MQRYGESGREDVTSLRRMDNLSGVPCLLSGSLDRLLDDDDDDA